MDSDEKQKALKALLRQMPEVEPPETIMEKVNMYLQNYDPAESWASKEQVSVNRQSFMQVLIASFSESITVFKFAGFATSVCLAFWLGTQQTTVSVETDATAHKSSVENQTYDQGHLNEILNNTQLAPSTSRSQS